MIIVFLGIPGSGKGTQSKMISQKFDMRHVSTGDIFREILRKDDPIAGEIKKYINAGKLVPDEITVDIVNKTLNVANGNGFLLDGFPRTINQAVILDGKLMESRKKIEFVVFLDIDSNISAARMAARRYCPECNANYNMISQPPLNDETCDVCGAKLEKRKDDDYETVRKRFDVYEEQTKPLLEYYEKQGKLHKVNADDSVEKVYSQIKKILENASGTKVSG